MRALPALLAAFAVGFGPLHAADQQLLGNGSFEAATDGKPSDWGLAASTSWETEPTNHFLRLTADPGKMVSLYREVSLTGIKAVEMTWRARYADVKRGEKPWFDARIMIEFKDHDRQAVAGAPPHPYYTGTSKGWREQSLRFAVPAGAELLTIMPTMFNAAGGTFDLDDLTVKAIDPGSLPPVQRDVDGGLVAEADAHRKAPLALHIDGNRILDADGKAVWLQGVAVPSLEWSNTGDAIVPSIACAIDTWKANIIRLPVMGARWFGKAQQDDGGAAYRAIVDQAVLAASSRGAWIIIDLHRYRAPTADDAAFWTDCAAHFKDNPAVLFGLLNEPHDISWDVWLKGGEVTDKKTNPDALAENKEVLVRTQTVGMQGLIDAVRATGARNVLVFGGLDWAYDGSGFLTGFAPDDKGGNGYVVDTHVYPWKSDWQHKFLDVAAKYPVLLGEVGCDAKRYDFIPPERFENPYTWAPDILACIQKNRLHWTAWAFHPHCGPAMLLDQKDFTPSPFWGSFVRATLLGAQWSSDRLR